MCGPILLLGDVCRAALTLLRRPSRYLSTDEYRTDTRTWATEKGLNIIHLPIDVSKDPTVEVDEDLVRQALEVVLGPSSSASAPISPRMLMIAVDRLSESSE